MIAWLKGCVVARSGTSVTLDVQGVGYEILCHSRVQCASGDTVTLWIETIIRPESWTLIGFLVPEERLAFRLIFAIPGVGGRTALNILSALPIPMLQDACLREDTRAFQAVEGVGPKLASRLSHELKNKILTLPMVQTGSDNASCHALTEAQSALENLGYPSLRIRSILTSLPVSDTETMIRKALSKLSTNP